MKSKKKIINKKKSKKSPTNLGEITKTREQNHANEIIQ